MNNDTNNDGLDDLEVDVEGADAVKGGADLSGVNAVRTAVATTATGATAPRTTTTTTTTTTTPLTSAQISKAATYVGVKKGV
jgi:hypothetical protein